MRNLTTTTKLSELPVGVTVEINALDFTYKGKEKRNLGFGKVECFIFYSEKLKAERTFEFHKTKNHELKKLKDKYKF